MSVKYQITLPDDLAHRLKREARSRNVPLAQFIRETMERQLKTTTGKTGAVAGHPLASIIGLVNSEERDLAARVDEILYR